MGERNIIVRNEKNLQFVDGDGILCCSKETGGATWQTFTVRLQKRKTIKSYAIKFNLRDYFILNNSINLSNKIQGRSLY